MELITGAGLAFSAGLNAYVPLLVLGLSGAFFGSVVQLPTAWAWLENPWVLGILGLLFVIEIIADKIPVVDTINNVLQTFVRPAAGGIAFGSGTGSTTTLVSDPERFFTSGAWVPVAVGIVIALVSHTTKSIARPVVHAASFGLATPVVSTAEDVGSVGLSIFSLVIPVVALFLLIGGIVLFIVLYRRARRRIRERTEQPMRQRWNPFRKREVVAVPAPEDFA